MLRHLVMVGAGLKVYVSLRFNSLLSRETKASGGLIWSHPGPPICGWPRAVSIVREWPMKSGYRSSGGNLKAKVRPFKEGLIVLDTACRTRRPFFAQKAELDQRAIPAAIYLDQV